MGWPIEQDSLIDVDDLFFDYTPEELGVDPGNAAKIKSIRQLRPLVAGQPFGIFFVQFEPKRLPVVALRRILGHVVVRKRASANRADRVAWDAGDLLFVSSYGDGDERQISFAHFSESADKDDLPTLKVLGWDNRDTALRLDAVAGELTRQLAWPENVADVAAWRERWSAAFTLRHREVVATSKELSIRLAELARTIRDRIETAVAIETDKGPLTKLMKAFQEALVHDLDADGFADMYAQTIAYGLLSARIADPHKKTADDLAAHMRTNPFLRELMETFLKVGGRRGKAGGPGIDFDELGVSDIVDLLDDANMEAVVRDFGDRNPQEDPVIHFYELFLKEYDAKKRMQRGVFYTPRPVVSYIVRSVDELLRAEFGLVDGLADTTTWGEMAKRHKDLTIPEGVSPDQNFVQILDPATGTGTFLVEAIDLIRKTLVAKWKTQGHGDKKIDALWNEYVPSHLLTRLHGYELLMAPYAIAHLKIGLKLYETGYRFGSNERARIYLTNALEPPHEFSGAFEFAIPALAHEAQAVNEVKGKRRFTVVVGNPPYSKVSGNMSEAAQKLVEAYKFVDGLPLNERKHWLQDDYVKFLSLCQAQITLSGAGTVGLITNHGFLDNPTFRGLRQSLTRTFPTIRILDLHGNSNKGEQSPDGSADENVFDIMQGVAVSLASSTPGAAGWIVHADLWGSREHKYRWLSTNSASGTSFATLAPKSPYYFFVPKDMSFEAEYGQFKKITEVMSVHSTGILTARDGFVIDFTDEPLLDRMKTFTDKGLSDEVVRDRLGLSENYAWRIADARKSLRTVKRPEDVIRNLYYRPFDIRRVMFHPAVVWRPRMEVMNHLLGGINTALVTSRMTKGEEFAHAIVSRDIVEVIAISSKTSNNAFVFPLFLAGEEESGQGRLGESVREPNFSAQFLRDLAKRLGAATLEPYGLPRGVTPEEIGHFVYAVLYCPSYRARYAEFLKIDFPRLPLSGNLSLFRALARLGRDLTALHLFESPKLDKPITEFIGGRTPGVDKISWSKNTVWVDKAQTIGFKGVREDVWNFHVGGYQVCEKWLKDRKGRKLSKDDIAHYEKIVVALAETIRLMKEIDEVIERHGGWPGAFAQRIPSTDAVVASDADTGAGAAPATGQQALLMDDEEPESSRPDREVGRSTPIDDLETDDLIGAVRQLFSDGSVRDRDTAIGDLAGQVGFTRIGSRIRESLDNALRTAVRRGILENNGSGLRTQARSFEEYDRAFLKDQFLASLQGKAWTEREDAVQGFARWMGFRRTGSTIAETARSLINGLIRDERLESDGTRIRRCG
jgi:hypothetical protein